MKHFNRVFIVVMVFIVSSFVAANLILAADNGSADAGRPYRVEISRLENEIRENGYASLDLSECGYVTVVAECIPGDDAFSCESDYVLREIDGTLYRFEYTSRSSRDTRTVWIVNGILAVVALFIIVLMLYIRTRILHPFERLSDVPYELSKGNLTVPMKEGKGRFFGRFVWGVDMLRENLEQQKARELALQKEKKTLLVSLSHDIKTPLSAIKLYAKAISSGLYDGEDKQKEIAVSIDEKANEIERYLSEIIAASNEDLFDFEVTNGEFYLSTLVKEITKYYSEKLALIHTEFSVAPYGDCLLKGDFDRSVEVIQNMMENAIKYGDGKNIRLDFSEEDGCQLISVTNSGEPIPEGELPHVFESFWRGSNAENKNGSGLGLYICRQLMHRMNGEVFVSAGEDSFTVTAVFGKA